jgi:hypothetical protein
MLWELLYHRDREMPEGNGLGCVLVWGGLLCTDVGAAEKVGPEEDANPGGSLGRLYEVAASISGSKGIAQIPIWMLLQN